MSGKAGLFWLYFVMMRAAIINTLANEIIKVLITGNGVDQSRHDDSFVKLFLQIVLHQNVHLTQMLDAFNKRKGQLQLKDINYINLIIPIAVKCQSDNALSIFQQMMQFTEGNRDVYEHIINNLSHIVSEGMSDWYQDMARRFNIEEPLLIANEPQQLTLVPSNTTALNTTALKHYPKLAEKNCTTTTTVSVPQKPQPLPLTPFPTEALKMLLEFADRFGVKEILERAHQEPEESSFANGVRCIPGVEAFLEGPGMIAKIVRGNLDLALVGNGIKSWINGDIDQVKKAGMELKEYFQNFCTIPEDNSTLNVERLMLTLVMDKGLKALLADERYQQIIAGLVAATHVKDVTEEKVGAGIAIFIQLQQLAQALSASENITTFAQLSLQLIDQDCDNTMVLIANVLNLIKQLQPLIKIFIQPKLTAIHLLVHPAIVGILSNIAVSAVSVEVQCPRLSPQNKPNETFINCAYYFLNYQEKGNGFLTTSTEKYVREKKLEHYHFSNLASTNEEEKPTIVHNFIGCGFDGFSFQHSTFTKVNLQDTYFKACDFSHTEFEGLITFDDTYMDRTTAETFLHALETSLLKKQCTVEGTITLVGKSEEILCIPKSITDSVGIVIGDADAAEWVEFDVEEKFPIRPDDFTSDTDDSFEDDSESTDEEESTYLGRKVDAVKGAGLGLFSLAKRGANALNPFGGTGQEDSEEGEEQTTMTYIKKLEEKVEQLEQRQRAQEQIQRTATEYLGNQQAHLQTQFQALPAQTTTQATAVPAIEHPGASYTSASLTYHDNSLLAIEDGRDKRSAPTITDISSDEDDFKSFSSDEESDDDMTPEFPESKKTPAQSFGSQNSRDRFFQPQPDDVERKEKPQQTAAASSIPTLSLSNE